MSFLSFAFVCGFDFRIHAPIAMCNRYSHLRVMSLCTNPYNVRKIPCKILMIKVWLPGMGSNLELDRFLISHKLLISKGR
jgi:hypothetical protein